MAGLCGRAADPPLLLDLLKDPDELSNVAGRPEHAARAASYAALIAARYDLEALRQAIVANQRARRLIADALM
jgi:choline-sulfatase